MTIFSSSLTVTNFPSILHLKEVIEVVASSGEGSEEAGSMGMSWGDWWGHGELQGLEGSHRS